MRSLPHLGCTFFTVGLAALLWAWVPSGASAQTTAALMPRVGGDDAVRPEHRDAARLAATAVLRDEGLLVIEALQIESLLGEPERQCLPSAPCVGSVLRAAGVEVLVGLVLLGDAARVERVWVYVVRGDGTREGAAAVEGDLADAVSDALRPLLDTEAEEPEDTEGPDGAAESGHSDEPGPRSPPQVQLEPSREDAPHWAVVMGAATIAVGLGAAVLPPALSYVSAGCTDMGCTEFEEVDDLVWVWTAVGGLVAGTGVGLLIWGASQGDASVEARLLPTGAQLEGRF